MTIKVWDYLEEYTEMRDEILAAVDGVFSSGWLILGEQVRELEREFASYCALETPGVGVNSGTDALFLGLKALGVGPGDEVITVPNTAVPTVSAITSTGATARFVDIEPQHYLMDPAALENAITPRTRAILPVHLYGQCVDMDAVNAVADRHGLSVLEDCAQCTGARYKGAPAGTAGDVGAWSFYPTKVLGAYGDGGMITAADETLTARARKLRMYGMDGRYYADEHGYNSRLDEVQAAILRVKLKRLDDWVERRTALAARYGELFADTALTLPSEREGNLHSWYLYVVRHPARDALLDGLRRRDILVNVSYPWPIHTMEAYLGLGYGEGDFPVAEKAATEILSLPMYPGLTETQQDAVVEAVRAVLKEIEAG
jgi:aminotransferase EvaB